ncbi:uncharacterized protein FMAN_05608 [Fusarium mangiferae]|uniref:Uncharacterized protein n=1 Tax=Fusarium mangiferae TaxID=192010 RepID=A0A1L7SLC5_FUSMA|nr:uncharacterized protein FMAN_05608 [Fusarium mangiferae]CVK87333.1 uncharacterized protein FMAN_05608 [Fusarium mangiferae]
MPTSLYLSRPSRTAGLSSLSQDTFYIYIYISRGTVSSRASAASYDILGCHLSLDAKITNLYVFLLHGRLFISDNIIFCRASVLTTCAGPSRQTAALAGRLQVAPSTVSQEVKIDPDSPFDYQFPKVSAEQLKRIIHKLFGHPNMFTIHDCQRATAGCMLNYKQNARSTGNCRSPSFALCFLPETCRWSAKGALTGRDINQRNIQQRIIVHLARRWRSHNFPANAQAPEKDISEAFIKDLDNYILNFHPQSGSQKMAALSPGFPPELREMAVKLLDASSLDALTKASKQCRQLFGLRLFYHMAFRGSEKVVEQGLKTLLRPSAHILPRPLGQVCHAIFFISGGRPLQSDKHSHRQAQDYPPSLPSDELPTLFRQALQEMPLQSISVNVELASPTLPGRLARGLRCLTADRAPKNFYHMVRDMCTPESLESLHIHEDINPIFTNLIQTVRFPNLKRLFAVLNEDRADWGVVPVRTLNELVACRCQGLEWLVLDHKHTLRETSAPDESLMIHPVSLADLDILTIVVSRT